jgi:hypothetical protein
MSENETLRYENKKRKRRIVKQQKIKRIKEPSPDLEGGSLGNAFDIFQH